MNQTKILLRVEAPDTATLTFGSELLTDPGFASAPDWTYYNNDGGHAQAVSLGAGGLRATVPSPVDYVQQGYYSTPSGGGVPCYYRITVVTGTIDAPLDGSANCAIYACYGGHCMVVTSPASNTTYSETFYADTFSPSAPAIDSLLVMVAIGDPVADGCTGGENFDVASVSLAKSTTCAVATSYELETFDSLPFPLTKLVADIREPENRHGEFSRTVSLPGTKDNARAFGHVFDSSVTGSFDFRKKVKCMVVEGGVCVMEGFLQLVAVSFAGIDNPTYEVVIFGHTVGLFEALGDSTLLDLDLSDMAHSLNNTNVANSWTGDYSSPGYVYPLVDLGYNSMGSEVATNSWPYFWSHSASYPEAEQMIPAAYARTLWDRVFAAAGYTYTSEFVSGASHDGTFNKLVVLGNTLSGDDGFDRVATYTFYSLSWSMLGPSTTPPTVSIRAKARGATAYTVLASVSLVGTGPIVLTATSASVSPDWIVYAFVEVGSATEVDFSVDTYLTAQYEDMTPLNAPGDFTAYASAVTAFFGDGVFTLTDVVSLGRDPFSTWDAAAYAHVVPHARWNMKQRDFVLALVRMFNLVIEPDRNDPKNLIVEPRDDYYDSSTVVRDWTRKLDVSSPIKMQLTGDTQARTYAFRYAEDSDHYNADYLNRKGEHYGDLVVDSGNEFVDGETAVELPFAATPSVGLPLKDSLGPLPGSDLSTYVVPVIAKFAEDGTAASWQRTTFVPRIMYYNYMALPGGKTWRFDGADRDHLPYAGHLDHPTASAHDLNWRAPAQYYFEPGTVTTSSLYQEFWRRQIEENCSADSRMMTAYFALFPTDVGSLRFSDRIYVRGQYWRLNKIEYDASGGSLARAELVRAIDIRFPAGALTVIE